MQASEFIGCHQYYGWHLDFFKVDSMATREQFRGCVLGLALGDAIGAAFEGGPLERFLWKMIGRTSQGEMRWTDDTQMTIDLIEEYLEFGQFVPESLGRRFYQSYRWSRGYGRATPRTLKRIANGVPIEKATRSVFREGSFGNGAAMRSPVLALMFHRSLSEAIESARSTAQITHVHPLGVEGAELLAIGTWLAIEQCESRKVLADVLGHCKLHEFQTGLKQSLHWIESGENVSVGDVKHQLGCGVAAHRSCVTAVYLGLRFRNDPFLNLMQFVTQLGGDADTIGAMAGAIWGTINGNSGLPSDLPRQLEQRERLLGLADQLFERVSKRKGQSD